MATATDTPTAARSVARVDSAIWLTVMIAASIVLRLVVNTRFQAPTILTDELTYSNLARQIADGDFSLSNGYGVIYPLLMAPSWAIAKYGTDAYTYMKATNAVLVSLTAIPVFLWARRMMRHGYALLAAGLTLLMPSMAYSGHVMTENAFVLFFMIAVWAIAVAVERPVILNQALLVVALALAFATRAQAIVLVPAVPLIIVLAAIAEERVTGAFAWRGVGRRLLRWWPLAALAGLGILAIVARTLLTGWHWNQLLQAYSTTADGQYTAQNVARYFLWHLGEATFALGVIPVAAFLVLVGLGILNRTRSASERAYLSTTIVAIPLVILQVATFTSYWSGRVSERNMFCVFPIVLIGLALWLNHGLPRTRRTAALAAAITGVLVLSVPFAFLYQRAPSTETWAVVLPGILARKLAGGADDAQVLIVIGVAIALVMFGVVRRDVATSLVPLLVGAYFVVSVVAAVHDVGKTSADYRAAPGVGADASWIERSAGAHTPVTLILGSALGPDTDRLVAWEIGFFNRNPIQVRNWADGLMVDNVTGSVATPQGLPLDQLVVTPSSHIFAGVTQATTTGWLLQEPAVPLRLATRSSGFFPDGWIAPTAWIDVYQSPDVSAKIVVDASRAFAEAPIPGTLSVITGEPRYAADGASSIPTPAFTTIADVRSDQTQIVTAQPSALPYRIAFAAAPPIVPTALGAADPRQLGARVSVRIGNRPIPG